MSESRCTYSSEKKSYYTIVFIFNWLNIADTLNYRFIQLALLIYEYTFCSFIMRIFFIGDYKLAVDHKWHQPEARTSDGLHVVFFSKRLQIHSTDSQNWELSVCDEPIKKPVEKTSGTDPSVRGRFSVDIFARVIYFYRRTDSNNLSALHSGGCFLCILAFVFAERGETTLATSVNDLFSILVHLQFDNDGLLTRWEKEKRKNVIPVVGRQLRQ